MPRAAAGCMSCKTEMHFKLYWVSIQLVHHMFKAESAVALATAQKQTHNLFHIEALLDILLLQTSRDKRLAGRYHLWDRTFILQRPEIFLKLYYYCNESAFAT